MFEDMKLEFPKNFLWGAATSSHQVEGGQHNDWSEWEETNAEQLAHEASSRWGHIPGWTEKFEQEASQPENYISGKACDHWNRYEEDFDILQELHLNAYRFSIEWSRVEPQEGQFDEAALEHYQRMIQALRKRNIEPFVTLWHWSNPLWIKDIGDWSNPKTVQHFLRYVEKVAHTLRPIHYWIPVNEPNIHTMYAYFLGKQPPGKKNIFSAILAFFHILSAHKQAAHIIRSHVPNAKIGMANSVICFEPKNTSILTLWMTRACRYLWNTYPFVHTRNANDFLGVNYYSRQLIGVGPKRVKDDCPQSDLGWSIYPEGILSVIRDLAPLKLPIYITENGLADAFDTKRTDFIHEHLAYIHRAITEEGADIRGYFHWSLLDNNEFVELRGNWPRFGLVAVDHATQKRTIRPSARAYANIAETNSLGT